MVLIATKKVILVLSFQSISINENNPVDNQIWILVHCYVVASWIWIPILLTLEPLVEGGIVVNIKNVIMVVFITYGGLTNEKNVK